MAPLVARTCQRPRTAGNEESKGLLALRPESSVPRFAHFPKLKETRTMRKYQPSTVRTVIALVLLLSCNAQAQERGFPFMLPKEKPNRKMSAAVDRNYSAYMAPRPEDNELYSLFKYTKLKGLDYNNHDGTRNSGNASWRPTAHSKRRSEQHGLIRYVGPVPTGRSNEGEARGR